MKIQKIYIAISVLVLLFSFSCKKEFLDKPYLDQIAPEDYFKDDGQLAAYTIGLYGNIQPAGFGGAGYFAADVTTDVMCAWTVPAEYTDNQYKVPQNGWSWNFGSIRSVNYFFDKVLPLYKANAISGNQELVKHYIGEAYFIRAMIYFGKLQALGDFPIVRHPLPDQSDVLIAASKRAPRNEVARFIISDLDSAIMLMNDQSPDGRRNRLSKIVAQVLKSRVGLYEGTWEKYFKGTAFVPNGTGWPGATKDYNKSYVFPSGSIDNEIEYFLTQAMDASKAAADALDASGGLVPNTYYMQQDPAQAPNLYFNMYSATNMTDYKEILLWREYGMSLGIKNTKAAYQGTDGGGAGVARGMVDRFLMANGLPIYDAASGYHSDDSIQSAFKDRDFRLQLFMKTPGQLNVLYHSANEDHVVTTELVPNVTNVGSVGPYVTGYMSRKGMSLEGIQWSINNQGSTGDIIFRGVEAYLNYIEASYEKTGSIDATADKYWRAIRKRGGVDEDYQKSISHTVMTKEALNDWGAYSGGQLVDPTLYNIRRERSCEFNSEGYRHADLKRWRAMDQLITNKYHIEGFKIWGPMKNWYDPAILVYNDPNNNNNVSDPARSKYLLPYEKKTSDLGYNGLGWKKAHYLEPIAVHHFLITAGTSQKVEDSPIYQNPGWPIVADQPATE